MKFLKEFLRDREKTQLAFMLLLTSIFVIAVEGFWYFALIVLIGILFFVIMPYFSKLFDLFYDKYINPMFDYEEDEGHKNEKF